MRIMARVFGIESATTIISRVATREVVAVWLPYWRFD
jgi:hypothetical protein